MKKILNVMLAALALAGSAQLFAASDSDSQRPMGPPPSFDEMDTNGDGELTSDELRGPLAEHFSDFDKDGSGGLSEDELPSPPGRQQ